MRTAAAVCVLLASALAGGTGTGEDAATGPVLLLPAAGAPCRLGLDVVMDGQSPSAAWESFLDLLFDYFDRDGDGSLSRAEVGRMFPLPLPGRKELALDFARLDADGDGKVTRAELKAFCRTQGFGPVVVVMEPPSADDLRLADLLFRRLDADGDGRLTREELRRAPELLRKLDLNEDEFLDRSELLSVAGPEAAPDKSSVQQDRAAADADVVLRVDRGARAPAIGGKSASQFRLETANGAFRLHGPGSLWTMTFRTDRLLPDAGSAREFLLAQFRVALGSRTALTMADLEQDPALGGLRGLFRYADRDGDNRLSLAELEAYLKLVERGVGSQVWVRVTDHGRNPFPFLDTDGDGRLSRRELARAGDLLGPAVPAVGRLPWQFQLSFGGPGGSSWGGVPIPAAARWPRPVPAATRKVPRWFEAMDRNGDGVLSPQEFLGPPELFRKLDADGDEVITPEEAGRWKD
jgi:Ca2+-binding EF-hand superfamily protein